MTISAAEYRRRRRALMQSVGRDALVILPAAEHALRNRDAEYPFRQDSDFLYLSGFDEPESFIVLCPGRREGQFLLFCRERDPLMETWHGYRAGPEGARQQYGADEAFPVDELEERMPGLLAGRSSVYFSLGRKPGLDELVRHWMESARSRYARAGKVPGDFRDLDAVLHEQRLYKSPAEQKLMRKAGKITAGAHRRAMRQARPGLQEYQLEAELLHEFMGAGARFPAYSSIVGSGDNACILHYVENRDRIEDGDLVLIDAGCELEHYAADVTRTFPANGRFSPAQRALYEIVLRAQEAAIAQVAPGKPFNRPHQAAVRVMTRGLVELGLLKGDPATLVRKEAYRRFYMHSTSHWLGLDVHDVGATKSGKRWRRLEPGMVLTIEPGLYVAGNDDKVAKKWRGIGIRIEDDVLVTEDGCEVLSGSAPKSVEDIEALMSEAGDG